MEQGDLLTFAIAVLERLNIPYMVVGSFTSGAYGEPRLTQDIDIVISPTPDALEALCGAFPSGDFYVSPEAARSALANRTQFNVIHPESGNKIDFMLSRSDLWGIEQLQRRQRIPILPGIEAFAARPEDVILSKLLYYQEGGSEKHLRDIAGILRTTGDEVDHQYIAQRSDQLAVRDIWDAVLRRAQQAN